MQTITVQIDDKNVDFFIELLKKLNFNTQIQIANSIKKPTNKELASSIRLPKGKPSINDFAGFWSDNPITLSQIREQAWKRI